MNYTKAIFRLLPKLTLGYYKSQWAPWGNQYGYGYSGPGWYYITWDRGGSPTWHFMGGTGKEALDYARCIAAELTN